MIIIILGPPGAGKGTQGDFLSKKTGLPRLSVGALIRKYSRTKSEIEKNEVKLMTRGFAISGKKLIQIIDKWVSAHKEGFIVDNLIRTKDQLNEFIKYQKEKKLTLDKVFFLNISPSTSMSRLKQRKKIKKRPDETEASIKRRIAVFNRYSEPILNYFRKQKILDKIDGEKERETIFKEMLAKLNL